MSVSSLRARMYEITVNGHCAVAFALLAGVWIHVDAASRLIRMCFLSAVAGHAASWTMDVFQTVLRMRLLTEGWPKATVHLFQIVNDTSNAELTVHVPRPARWTHAPGQYVLLNLRDGSWRSYFQRHPFVITAWPAPPQTEDMEVRLASRDRTVSIYPRRGFTRRLQRRVAMGSSTSQFRSNAAEVNRKCDMKVLLSGPYGRAHPVENYHTLLAIAHHGRIASILPYLVQVLTDRTTNRRVTCVYLVWQVEVEGELVNIVEDANR